MAAAPASNQDGRSSLTPYVGQPDHLAPFLDCHFDHLGELLRCAADGVEAKAHHMLLRVWGREGPDDLAVEQRGDVLGRPCRDEETDPALALYAWVAGFCRGGYV